MKQPTVFITNQFYNEAELLDLKLNEIGLQLEKYNIDWKMILVESTETFTKKPKDLYYANNKEKYPYNDKIINYTINGKELFLPTNSPMENDFIQKRYVTKGLEEYAKSDDIVIVCDLDEIPDFRKIIPFFGNDLNNVKEIWTIQLALFYYSYNNFASFRDDRVTIFPYKLFQGIDAHRGQTNRKWMQLDKDNIITTGWHFSYCGNAEFIHNKINNFGHSECNRPEVHANLEENIKNNTDPYGRPFSYPIIPIDLNSPQIRNFYPEYFCNNIEKYRHNIRGEIKQ